jgi:DNA-binding NtrC family response regulator
MSTVLIVDDCAIMRSIIRNLIESSVFGISVLELGDGYEVLDYIQTFDVKLLILDMVLVYESGEDVLYRLNNSDLPVHVIILSGNYSESSFEEMPCVKAVFSKPVDPELFIDAVKSALDAPEDT